uniref:deoxyribonuclease-1-like isoform X2 n=1 Tax=Monopterus albus TaxID=43700 RepID=UPI0009B3E92F|nr:deoxyribonuclease-1-like isoform X2 [Monopterus albus]
MKIAAFNAKKLGMKKVNDEFVMRYLVKILSRYSVVVVLEVVDKDDDAMNILLDELNSNGHDYNKICSPELGRGTYKEKFVCFYRENEVTLVDQYQYEDDQAGDEDAFAREPFILHFNCSTAVVKDMVLIPVHTKPQDAWKELDELHDVVEFIKERWGIKNIIILGDFNADGRYLSKKEKKMIRICSPCYHWLIDDDVDTTASNSNDHTYDRIVVYGKTMLNGTVPKSAKPFNFQRAFRLSPENQRPLPCGGGAEDSEERTSEEEFEERTVLSRVQHSSQEKEWKQMFKINCSQLSSVK